MALTKTTPASKTKGARTTEKPALSKPATPGEVALRTAAQAQIRSTPQIEGSATKPITALESAQPEPAYMTADLRQQMIRDAAYCRAERRGFSKGDSVQDWMEAEVEIDRMLRNERGSLARP